MKLISLIIPVYNEEDNILPLYEEVLRVISSVSVGYDWEFVFTDNHSTDNTFQIISSLASHDSRIRLYRFSRNYGYQLSILYGYRQARGDAAIQLDADMQDPPALISRFITFWEQGYSVVYGVRYSRKESWWINVARKIFYRSISHLSEQKLPIDAGDFRLIDRKIIDIVGHIDDSLPYLRGTIAALGFNQIGVEYSRDARIRGESKFSFMEYIHLAIDGVLNHSVVPLRVATFTGMVVSAITLLALSGYLVAKIFFHRDWPAGFATTTVLILLSLSLNALFLGIIGEYLGRIYKQVKRQPGPIVEVEVGNTLKPRPLEYERSI